MHTYEKDGHAPALHIANRDDNDSRLAEDDPESSEYSVGIRTLLAIFALALTNCTATLTNTTNTIIGFQVKAVGGASVAGWIANGNFLLTLVCAPIFGNLSDGFGKKLSGGPM